MACLIPYYCDDDSCPSYIEVGEGLLVQSPTGEPTFSEPSDPNVDLSLVNVCDNECSILEEVEVDGETCLQALWNLTEEQDCEDRVSWDKTTNTLNISPLLHGRIGRAISADCGAGPLGFANVPGGAWSPGPALPIWGYDTTADVPGCGPMIQGGPTQNTFCVPADGEYAIGIFVDWRAQANGTPINADGSIQGYQIKRTRISNGNTVRVGENVTNWPIGLSGAAQTGHMETFLEKGDKITYCLYTSLGVQDTASITFYLTGYEPLLQSSSDIVNPDCPDPFG